jgi:hypothetical protein
MIAIKFLVNVFSVSHQTHYVDLSIDFVKSGSLKLSRLWSLRKLKRLWAAHAICDGFETK